MTASPAKYALWLLPAGDPAREFSSAISTLAQQYHAPGFAPHVTLACGTDAKRLSASCEQLAATSTQIRVQPTGLEHGDSYFRHLYVNLAPCRSLAQLQRLAAAQCDDRRPFQPHLSLLYRDAALSDAAGYRRALAHLELRPFALNSLALIELAAEPADWRELARHPLQP